MEKPFSYQYGKKIKGLSVDIWEQIAAEIGIKYRFIPMTESEDKALNQLNSGNLDALIGPVMVTHHYVNKASFSRPYFINKLGIIYKSRSESFWSVISAIFKETLFIIFIFYIGMLTLFILLFYIFEYQLCKKKQEPPPHFFHFIWPTIITLLSLNLVRKSSSVHDKVANVFWMLISLSFIAIFSAMISASLTISHSDISYSGQQNFRKLTHQKVAIIKGTYADYFTDRLDIEKVYVPNYQSAIKMVEEGKVEAFIDNYATINYKHAHFKNKELFIKKMNIGTSEIAFAFRKEDPIIAKIDNILTKLQDSNKIRYTCLQYLKDNDAYFCFI